jgi:WD40 repeat protein
MLSSDEGEIDVFFDSVDHLSSEEFVAKEELNYVHLEYGIWMNEPVSVKERRESFLRGMGLAESASSKICAEEKGSSEMVGLERVTECSGAVSSSRISSTDCAEENLVCCGRDGGNQANAMFDELEGKKEDKEKLVLNGQHALLSTSAQEYKNLDLGKRKLKSWLKSFVNKTKRRGDTFATEVSKPNSKMLVINRMKVWQNQKGYLELTALYSEQEIRAHKGLIWTMKFSPDGQYLASGGEDGVVRIWRVTSAGASYNYPMVEDDFGVKVKGGKSIFGGKMTKHATIVIPENVLHIEESPLQEFHGHSSGVLDLSWSNSNVSLLTVLLLDHLSI